MPPEAESHELFFVLGSRFVAAQVQHAGNFCTSRRDSTNDSSHHVNVAQYSMWLLDARGCVGAHAFEFFEVLYARNVLCSLLHDC